MNEYKYLYRPKAIPKKLTIISFDVETYSDSNTFYLCGVLSDKDGYKVFYDKYEAINYLNKFALKNTIIYANNLLFDLGVLYFNIDYIDKIVPIFSNNMLISATINISGEHKLKLRFCDTMNYGIKSVYSQGKIIGLGKLEKPEFLGRKPSNAEEERILLDYNKRDCEITKGYAEFFQDTVNNIGGQMRLTIASTSKDIYTRKYMVYPIKHRVQPLIFNAYYGGRTEAFHRGLIEKGINVYDINSLFPSMLLKAFPHPYFIKKGVDLNEFGYTEAIINTTNDDYPFLPFRTKDKLLFPNGIFKGWYINQELIKAKELGYKIKPLRGYHFTRNDYFFEDFIKEIYKKRLMYKKQGNMSEIVMKLIMNSGYGKWGERALKEKTSFFKYVDSLKDKEDINWNEKGLGYKVEDVYKEANHMIPVFSAYTTAYARIEMYDYLKNNEALYIDTDSIFTYKKIKNSSKLGEMKLEVSDSEGIIVRPKLYLINGKVKSKGFPHMEVEDFSKILLGEKYSYTKFSKFKESIKRGLDFNQKIIVNKLADLEDTKRLWDKKFCLNEMQVSKPLIIKK